MRSNFIGKSLHCCYSPRRLVCHEVCASNVGTTRWIAAGGGCGGGPVVEQRSLVCSSRNGEICRTWGGDQRDREEWKISFQELDGLEGLDWEGLEWMEWLEGLEWDGLDWEGLEGLEWLEVVRLEFLELEELDLELQKLRVSEKKMKKTLHLASFVLNNFCLKVKFGRWQTWGEMTRFVLRGTLRERRYVGSCWQEQWKGWNPFQQSGPKAQRFHDHRFDLAGERTVLKIHPRRSAEMCGKNKILWENVFGLPYFGTLWVTSWPPRPLPNMGNGCLSLWLWVMWARETQLERMVVLLGVLHFHT